MYRYVDQTQFSLGVLRRIWVRDIIEPFTSNITQVLNTQIAHRKTGIGVALSAGKLAELRSQQMGSNMQAPLQTAATVRNVAISAVCDSGGEAGSFTSGEHLGRLTFITQT